MKRKILVLTMLMCFLMTVSFANAGAARVRIDYQKLQRDGLINYSIVSAEVIDLAAPNQRSGAVVESKALRVTQLDLSNPGSPAIHTMFICDVVESDEGGLTAVAPAEYVVNASTDFNKSNAYITVYWGAKYQVDKSDSPYCFRPQDAHIMYKPLVSGVIVNTLRNETWCSGTLVTLNPRTPIQGGYVKTITVYKSGPVANTTYTQTGSLPSGQWIAWKGYYTEMTASISGHGTLQGSGDIISYV